MNTDIQILFVSGCAADAIVLTTLLRQGAGDQIARLSAVPEPRAFFSAVDSQQSYQVIMIDDRLSWSDWHRVADTCSQSWPNALILLMTGPGQLGRREVALGTGVAGVYPRTSAGLLALACLVSKLTSLGQGAGPYREGQMAGETTSEDTFGPEPERLVYAVSHDLQDPLQLARRYAEILTDDFHTELGDNGAKVLGHLTFNLDRTQEMLDELLEYSRLQNTEPNLQSVDLNELFDEVVGLYRLTLEEIGGSVKLQNSLPTLVVDRKQFHRVLQNLISNAIKFRADRPLQVAVRAQQVQGEWRIGVKDNAVGMAEDDAKRVFGMFERAAGSEEYPGTGMGLAICRKIIHKHGGKIWVRSSPGKGSVFIFSVPQTDTPGSSGD